MSSGRTHCRGVARRICSMLPAVVDRRGAASPFATPGVFRNFHVEYGTRVCSPRRYAGWALQQVGTGACGMQRISPRMSGIGNYTRASSRPPYAHARYGNASPYGVRSTTSRRSGSGVGTAVVAPVQLEVGLQGAVTPRLSRATVRVPLAVVRSTQTRRRRRDFVQVTGVTVNLWPSSQTPSIFS